MSSSDEKANGSGLPPSQSRKVGTRQPNEQESKICSGLKDLYTCNPSEQSYSVYAEDALFHDPVGYASGLRSIRAQFNALSGLFPRADIDKFDVLENPSSSDMTAPTAGGDHEAKGQSMMLVDQIISYHRAKDSKEPFKTLNSLLTIKYESQSGLIKTHTEEWDHKAQAGHGGEKNSFMEEMSIARKKVTAQATEAMADQTPPANRG